MAKVILGKKLGMTQIFTEEGKVVPVTVVESGKNVVLQSKTVETDGYNAVQIGFGTVKEKNVTSPIASEISRIYVEIGEVAAAGLPLATLVDLSDQWAVFNIREDDMPKITKGAVLSAEIPALNAKNVQFKVYFINPRGDYATWRATRQSSGYDLRTFEVRARPVQPVSDLRPGMSVIVNR